MFCVSIIVIQWALMTLFIKYERYRWANQSTLANIKAYKNKCSTPTMMQQTSAHPKSLNILSPQLCPKQFHMSMGSLSYIRDKTYWRLSHTSLHSQKNNDTNLDRCYAIQKSFQIAFCCRFIMAQSLTGFLAVYFAYLA